MLRKFGKKAGLLALALALAVGLNPAAALAADNASAGASIAPGAYGEIASASSSVNYGYIPKDTPAESIHENDDADAGKLSVLGEADLPEKYSSRAAHHVTPARNQGDFGTCWAFSSIGAIEASLLAHGQVDGEHADELDLSERHLVYFTYNAVADPLGNTAGDKTTVLAGGDYLTIGGNEIMAAYTLASWLGTVDESVAPYDAMTGLADAPVSDELAYSQDNYHLRDMRRIAMTDSQDVKKAIMEYGAAAVGVCCPADNRFFTRGPDSQQYLYSYGKDAASNHSVLLVGWDDTVDCTCFGTSDETRPKQDGAWLVKNSWGADWGEDGFFWVSYEDKCFTEGGESAIVFAVGGADEFDNVYQYDGSAYTGSRSVLSGGGIANMFIAKGSEQLKAVSFALDATNVSYSIQVYLNPASSKDPTSGTAALSSPVRGATSYAGYYTVDLPSPVSLAAGTSYSVVITLTKAGSRVAYCCDANHGDSLLEFTNQVEAGQSFVRSSEIGTWSDLAKSANASARIKAFTSNASESDGSQEPSNPDDPNEPQDPAGPEDPEDPQDPQEPQDPADPENPDDPQKPQDPAGPEDPEDPEDPQEPQDPAGPEDPENPQGPQEPQDPAESQKTDASQGSSGTDEVSDSTGQGGNKISDGRSVKRTAQKLAVAKSQLSKSVSAKKVKKAAKNTSKVVVKGAKTKLTYKKASGSKRLSIGASTGKIKVKKGTKKGTYRIRVRVAAKQTEAFKAASKAFTVKVRVV